MGLKKDLSRAESGEGDILLIIASYSADKTPDKSVEFYRLNSG